MPRTRAYRRHKRQIKLARRYRITEDVLGCLPTHRDPRQRHLHIRCNCFDDPRERGHRRRCGERAWRELEGWAW